MPRVNVAVSFKVTKLVGEDKDVNENEFSCLDFCGRSLL